MKAIQITMDEELLAQIDASEEAQRDGRSAFLRGAPSEVVVGIDGGLQHVSAVNLDHVQTVAKAGLRTFLGTLSPAKMHELCSALAIAVGCDEDAPHH